MSWLDRMRALRRSRFTRDFVWIGTGQVASIGVRLVGIRVLTELVEPDVFGVVGLTIGVAILARNVLGAPILEASWRFYADAAEEQRIGAHRALLGRLLGFRTGLATALLAVGGIGWGVWQRAPDVAWSFAAVALLSVLETQRMFELRLLNASRRQLYHAGWTLLDEALRVVGAVSAVLWLGPTAASVLLGYSVGTAAATAAFWRARVRGEGDDGGDAWRAERTQQVLRYALPLSLLAVVGWIFNFSDRYVLAALAGAEITGVYVAAYGLASHPFIVTARALNLSFRPVYNAAAVSGDLRRERRVFLLWSALLAAVLFLGVAAMAWLAEPLTSLLLAERYADAAVLLPWIGAAYALQGCKQVFEAVIYAEQRTRLLVVVQAVVAPVSLGLYVVLIPELGALGAAIGTLAGMAVALLAIGFLSGTWSRLLRGVPAPATRSST